MNVHDNKIVERSVSNFHSVAGNASPMTYILYAFASSGRLVGLVGHCLLSSTVTRSVFLRNIPNTTLLPGGPKRC